MNRLLKKTMIAVTMTAMISTSIFASEGSFGAGAAAETEDFTLEAMLQYALEDERMAQAEYAAIMEAFDVTNPFSNIARAEMTHEAAIIRLYEARDLEVPEFDGSEHVILPEDLQDIYAIGVQAEINNIAMYEKFLEEDLEDDVRAVFEALKRGSEFHLAAFERGAEGGTGSMNRNGGARAIGRRNGNTDNDHSNNRRNRAMNTDSCLIVE